MSTILIVEDDLTACKTMLEWLQASGYDVEFANSGEEALQTLEQKAFDLLILDWELPGISGYDVLVSFRESGGTAPVIFLTGRTTILDKLNALELGADDYLIKPCDPQELTARIRAKLRRSENLLPSFIELANTRLDASTAILLVNGKDARLSKREFAVLEFLMRHQDRVFRSKELLDSVWESDSDATENSVRQIVFSLRRKLEKAGAANLVRKLPGGGYSVEREYSNDS